MSEESVVIVGMGCVYPGAHSPEELWTNVLAGRRHFRKAPPERMPPEYFDRDPDTPDKSYCDKMAVITDWKFDPVRFRIPPNTVRASDMTHWLALFTAEQAIARSSIDLDAIDRSRVGVLLGNSLAGEFARAHNLRLRWPYMERGIRRALGDGADVVLEAIKTSLVDHLPEQTEDSLGGNMSNTITGRICNRFDFGGGAFTVDGACSSSLLSVALGCNALRDGDMDLVVAGGVDISLDPFEIVGFAKTQALAKDDIRPFDQRAAGMMTGEGCGVILLAREQEARARGWSILARIRGWGYSSDGRGGLTAPAKEGQVRALHKAYRDAGYPMASVGYIEGHGTGTRLGDKIELAAILSQLDGAARRPPCRIGSIKANIGHCKAAAGVAGMIKAVMALQRAVIPPTLNCDLPNALFKDPPGRLAPTTEGLPWTANGTPRRASVNSLGFGGANSHITLEEADPRTIPARADLALTSSSQKSELATVSAPTAHELLEQLKRLTPVAGRISMAELTDLSAAMLKCPPRGSFRVGIMAKTPWALADALGTIAAGLESGKPLASLDSPEQGIFAGETLAAPRLAGIFSGQAAHRVNMGRDYFRRYPFVRDLHAAAETELSGLLPESVGAAIFRDDTVCSEEQAREWEQALRDTRVAQPAITLTSVAILRVLRELGLSPDIAVGHSLGKLAALHAAGAIHARTAVRMAAWRGEAMASLALDDNGAMAAVMAAPPQVEQLIEARSKGVVISNYNAPTQTVVLGSTQAVNAFVEAAGLAGFDARLLPVSHAFHSDIVAPAAETFAEKIARIDFEPLSGTYVSTHTGKPVASDTDLVELLVSAIRRPVDFQAAVEGAAKLKPTLWVEIGPGGILSGLVRQILGLEARNLFTTDNPDPDTDAHTQLNRIVARAFVQGLPVHTAKLFKHRYHKEGFDPDSYAPVFITNPLERPVELPSGDAVLAPSVLLPAESAEPGFAQYIRDRGDFIRDMIRLDYRNHAGPPPAEAPTAPAKPSAREPQKKSEDGTEQAVSLQSFVIEWIARRTGFPPESITPEMKLRDDLNLDSIKVGELAIEIGRFAGTELREDPSVWANAPIATLVEATEKIGRGDSAGKVADGQALPGTDGIAHWTRTFSVDEVPAPIADEPELGLPRLRRAFVVGADSALGDRLSAELGASGLEVEVSTIASLLSSGERPADLSLVVYVLPNESKCVSELGHDRATARIEGAALDLFRLFKWIGHGWEGEVFNQRCVVVRQTDDAGDSARDMDAGAALLKTIRLEYGLGEDIVLKWIVLPATWEAEHRASVVLDELQHRTGHVAFRYTIDGERLMNAARAVRPGAARQPPRLDHSDVFLVSGGAKGITFELALGLARETGVKLALLGSSPPLGAEETTEANEIERNLKRLASAGVTAGYFQADVTDPLAVEQAAVSARQHLGEITGILHGAGITELRLFRDMDEASFLRCVRIKTTGLYNLLAVVETERLKAIHLVSSVLGKTGMRGQADYTYANAWLDGTAESLAQRLANAQVLSLGYSLWAETGLGVRLGLAEHLKKVGVNGIGTEDGVRSYVDLVMQPPRGSIFTITGRLPSEIEANLYAPRPIPGRPRYLERVLRHIPRTELVAEAFLSHESDLYLPEHVFEGTPMFPGVMAIEAMAQAAMHCASRTDMPVFRNVRFLRPLIVPVDAQVKVRVLALADSVDDEGEIRVRAAMRSEVDDFRENHFETECRFGVTGPADLPQMSDLPDVIRLDPESFAPVPLFQGKFFRRIESIRILEDAKRSLTDIRVPKGEKYFADEDLDRPVTGCPAILDSYLQSGSLILPPGCLPASIAELHLLRPATAEDRVHCEIVVDRAEEGGFRVQIACRDTASSPICLMRDLVVELPNAGERRSAKGAAAPVPWERLESDLRALLPDLKFGIASVTHADLPAHPLEVTASELQTIRKRFGEPRQQTVLENLMAAKRALAAFMERYGGPLPDLRKVYLDYRPDGKPFFLCKDESVAEAVSSLCVTIADSTEVSLAMVSDHRIGVDLEPLEVRNAETWRALLGDDGYRLALRVQAQIAESFDLAATRVWTLLEAGKKAAELRRLVPVYKKARRESWHGFDTGQEGNGLKHLCACLSVARDASLLVFSLAEFGKRSAAGTQNGALDETSVLQRIRALTARLSDLQARCAGDPGTDRTEKNHIDFEAVIEDATEQVRAIERSTTPTLLPRLRKAFQQMLIPFLDGSVLFKRSLTKPLGYAGDYLTLDMMARNENEASGLGYHFDRLQLDDPASRAVRYRVNWVMQELVSLARSRDKIVTVLDLGAGAMPVEQKLLQYVPDIQWRFIGVDIEPQALEYCRKSIQGENIELQTHCSDLTTAEGIELVAELARGADAVVGNGILEALSDVQAIKIAKTLRNHLHAESSIYLENYTDDNPNRIHMEWFMDFHLGYRSNNHLRHLLESAGFDSSRIEMSTDPSGVLALAKVTQTASSAAAKRQTPSSRAAHVHRKFDFGVTADTWKAQVSTGENSRPVAKFRFVLPFSDACSVSRHVPFHKMMTWMGSIREVVNVGHGRALANRLAQGDWGLVTNEAEIVVHADIGALSVVEVWLWNENMQDLRFVVQEIEEDSPSKIIAEGTQRFASVNIVDHGKVERASPPEFFDRFLKSMQTGKEPFRTSQDGALQHLQPGRLLESWSYPTARTRILSQETFHPTTVESNVVGNVWYGNYFKWQAHVLDRLLARHVPEIFRDMGRSGELVVRRSRMTFFNEAMPMERLEARLFVLELHECGIKVGMEYHKAVHDSEPVKLSTAEIDALWVIRDATGVPISAPLPSNLRHAFSRHRGG